MRIEVSCFDEPVPGIILQVSGTHGENHQRVTEAVERTLIERQESGQPLHCKLLLVRGYSWLRLAAAYLAVMPEHEEIAIGEPVGNSPDAPYLIVRSTRLDFREGDRIARAAIHAAPAPQAA